MTRGNDRTDAFAKADLAKEAYELGLEVGEEGHEDSSVRVETELRRILQKAEGLGLTDVVRRRYEFGKEKGRVRRDAKQRPGQTGSVMRAQTSREQEGVSEIPEDARGGGSQRASSEEGIWSTISVMRFARGDEEMQSHLGNMFACVGDLHDRIMRMEPEGTPEETFRSSLRMITSEGWLSSYQVKFFDQRSAMASVDTTSVLARSFGRCDTPMCLPILSLMETVGFKTFGRPVLAIEEHCMAQGHDNCRFKLFPREVRER